jgi:PEP-CTERM motif
MKFFRKTILAVLSIGLSGTVLCPWAQAAPITGRIDFGAGTVTYDTNSLATAKQVNTWTNVQVTLTSGDFSSVALGTQVNVAAPWIFNPSTATTPFWSVGGFTFNLSSSVVVAQNANFLDVTGPGIIMKQGFDNTPGIWSFTSTDSNGQDQNQFTFTTDTTAVPEPGTTVTLLLGLGLMAALGRRFKGFAN